MNIIAKVITGVAVIAGIGGGVYGYSTNEAFRKPVDGMMQSVLHKSESASAQQVHQACFIIFDPSGSGKSSYSVPQLDTTYVNRVIERIRQKGSGEVWLSMIDADAHNNRVLYMPVPEKQVAPSEPTRTAGESMKQFNDRYKDYEATLKTYQQTSPADEQRCRAAIHKFLEECQEMIAAGYAPKSKNADFSDITGSLNVAIRTFSTVTPEAGNSRSVLLISDAVQSMPAGAKAEPLGDIPGDIRIVLVNAGGSRNNVIQGKPGVAEVEDLDRALTIAVPDKPNH